MTNQDGVTNRNGGEGDAGRCLADLDRRHVWHPFTQHESEPAPILIARGAGASLFDFEGREILDLISSWWTCIHGHAHPALNAALAEQAGRLEHVMFAGFTHEPAVRLAAALAKHLSEDLDRIFFSDDGSTAIEVALKIAYQHWRNRGEAGRRLFLAFEGGYHGDTLGAMALGRGSGFFHLFEDLMIEVAALPFAETWSGDEGIAAREAAALAVLDEVLAREGARIAALVMEPLCQGAGGMRMCRPEFVTGVAERCRAAGVLVIFDEIAVGFGRLGTLFAHQQTDAVPDILCLSKGLTAGTMPLSATIVREAIFEGFLGPGFERALAHGHSFTANPLASAVALRSLALFEEERTFARIGHIAGRHRQALADLARHGLVTRPRAFGTILAFDLAGADAGYKSEDSLFLKAFFLGEGLNIRPLGPTVYLMPPYCITDAELDRAYAGLGRGLDALAARSRPSRSRP